MRPFSSNGFARATDNTDSFRDLIHMKMLELNGIVRFIIRSVHKQFASTFARANLLSIF
jgi:anti-anti-sigma regulatory factor